MAVHPVPDTSLGTRLGRRRMESTNEWQARRIGPRFRWADRDKIVLIDGPLAGSEYGVKVDIQRSTAELALYDGDKRVGEVSIERDPPGKGVVLWDIGVREWLRGNGLAAVMTWVVFRELLLVQETSTFRIRMVRSLKAGDQGAEIQNTGIGVIAARLGFEPEIDVGRALDRRNIVDIDVIPRRDGSPPGLKIMVRSAPLVLVAFMLDPDTMKPLIAEEMYFKLREDERLIRQWAMAGHIVISNGDYVLRRSRAERFADLLATDEAEARLFRIRVIGR